MTQLNRGHLLNYKSINLLMRRVFFDDVTVADFEVMEELLDAFGKPRDLVLTLLCRHGIFSYADYVAMIKKRTGIHSQEEINQIAMTIHNYLEAMARYFIKDRLLKPEIWELKNPQTL